MPGLVRVGGFLLPALNEVRPVHLVPRQEDIGHPSQLVDVLKRVPVYYKDIGLFALLKRPD